MTRDDGVGVVATAAEPVAGADEGEEAVPGYLRDVYRWAYLTPLALAVFDRRSMVSAILWGNFSRLEQSVLDEVRPGDRALQLAAVYGPFSGHLLEAVGTEGSLDIVDVAPIQVDLTRRKLAGARNARVMRGDAQDPPAGSYDLVVVFFLLHEVPESYKRGIVTAALARLRVGGRAVFVDYHEPARWHPLRPLMGLVFDRLEPFAKGLWGREISGFAGGEGVRWTKTTFFGGLYQKVVAERHA